ncbi:hypothetical protein J6590_075409 [Homalodisca vitripennis]|nr:hypothetical protein J6590_075409 [Homalodisca vitripennis]
MEKFDELLRTLWTVFMFRYKTIYSHAVNAAVVVWGVGATRYTIESEEYNVSGGVESRTHDWVKEIKNRAFLQNTFVQSSKAMYKHMPGAHGGIVQSRTEVDLILTDLDKDKREANVSLPLKMLVKYTAGKDCQHLKSGTIYNNKKYTEENSV